MNRYEMYIPNGVGRTLVRSVVQYNEKAWDILKYKYALKVSDLCSVCIDHMC